MYCKCTKNSINYNIYLQKIADLNEKWGNNNKGSLDKKKNQIFTVLCLKWFSSSLSLISTKYFNEIIAIVSAGILYTFMIKKKLEFHTIITTVYEVKLV